MASGEAKRQHERGPRPGRRSLWRSPVSASRLVAPAPRHPLACSPAAAGGGGERGGERTRWRKRRRTRRGCRGRTRSLSAPAYRPGLQRSGVESGGSVSSERERKEAIFSPVARGVNVCRTEQSLKLSLHDREKKTCWFLKVKGREETRAPIPGAARVLAGCQQELHQLALSHTHKDWCCFSFQPPVNSSKNSISSLFHTHTQTYTRFVLFLFSFQPPVNSRCRDETMPGGE